MSLHAATPGPLERKAVQLLQALGAFFAARDVEAYLVGGFVRDSLLGLHSHDIDVAVAGDTQTLARVLAQALDGSFVPLDPEHGIFRIVLRDDAARREATDQNGNPNETGETWHVDLSAMQGDIQQDLARRDFTVNAMAVSFPVASKSPPEWPVLDPLGGLTDLLRNRVVRAVSPVAIQEDPVRALRAVRLTARLGFTIEPDTQALMSREAPRLTGAAPERVRDELLGILAQPGASSSLSVLDGLGLLDAVLPELSKGRGVTQPFEHYWDVFDHSIQAVGMVEHVLHRGYREEDEAGRSIPWEPWLDDHLAQEVSDGHTRATILKLTALLHDVAKPETKTVDPSGRARFLGHTTLGAEMAEAILKRLRLSRRGIGMVRMMVEEHLRPGQLAQRGQHPTLKAIYRYFRDLEDVAVDTLYLSLADYLAARGPTLDLEDWHSHCDRIAFTLQEGTHQAEPRRIPKLVDGHDLTTLFKLQPGPRFRPLLEIVREAQATGVITSREEALALVKRTLKKEAPEGATRKGKAGGAGVDKKETQGVEKAHA